MITQITVLPAQAGLIFAAGTLAFNRGSGR